MVHRAPSVKKKPKTHQRELLFWALLFFGWFLFVSPREFFISGASIPQARSLDSFPRSSHTVKTMTVNMFYKGNQDDALECCDWDNEDRIIANAFAFSSVSVAIWNLWQHYAHDLPQDSWNEVHHIEGPNNYWVSDGQTLQTYPANIVGNGEGEGGGMWTFTSFDPAELVDFVCSGGIPSAPAATPAPTTVPSAAPSPLPTSSPTTASSTNCSGSSLPPPSAPTAQKNNVSGDNNSTLVYDTPPSSASASNCSFSSYTTRLSPCNAYGTRVVTFYFLPGYSHCDPAILPAPIDSFQCDHIVPFSLLGGFVFIHTALALITTLRILYHLHHHGKSLAFRMSQPFLSKVRGGEERRQRPARRLYVSFAA